MLTEEFKVAAIVEDEEPPLAGVLPRLLPVDGINAAQILAETGTPANHLPELRL